MPLPSAPRNCPAGAGAKSPPASAGDTGDPGSTPGSERCPGVENGNPLQCSCPECRGQRSLAGYGQQRAGHDWAHTHTHTHTQEPWTPECGSISGSTVTRAGWRWHPWRWARSHGTEMQWCQLTEGGCPALVRRCLLWFARLFLLPKKEWVFQGQSPRTLGEREKKKTTLLSQRSFTPIGSRPQMPQEGGWALVERLPHGWGQKSPSFHLCSLTDLIIKLT